MAKHQAFKVQFSGELTLAEDYTGITTPEQARAFVQSLLQNGDASYCVKFSVTAFTPEPRHDECPFCGCLLSRGKCTRCDGPVA